jgi:predicted RNA-binding protein
MCESTVFLEDENGAHEAMKEVARIVMEGKNAVCTDVLGERIILENVRFKEANLLSHGIVFKRN